MDEKRNPLERPQDSIEAPDLSEKAREVLKIVNQNIGCNARDVRNQTGITSIRFSRTLRELVEKGFVQQFTTHRNTHLFPIIEGVEKVWFQFTTLCNPKYVDLYKTIEQLEFSEFRRLAAYYEAEVGLHAQTIRRRLDRLQNAGLVKLYRDNNDLRRIKYRLFPIDPLVLKLLIQRKRTDRPSETEAPPGPEETPLEIEHRGKPAGD